MTTPDRARHALNGTVNQRDLTPDEARQFDAMVAARIDDAISQADFTAAPLRTSPPSHPTRTRAWPA